MEHDNLSPQADASAENAKYLAMVGNSQNTITFFIALKIPRNAGSCHISWMNTGRLEYLQLTLPEIRERGFAHFRDYLHPADLHVLEETLKKLEKHKSEAMVTTLYRAQDKFRNAYFWYYCQVSACDYFPDGSIKEVQVNVFEFPKDKQTNNNITRACKDIFNKEVQEKFKKLSTRQAEVLTLILKGYSDIEIGEILVIKYNTVRSYRQRIRVATKIHNIAELIAQAIESGLFQCDADSW